MPNTFETFLTETDIPERTLAIVRGEHPKPIRDLFTEAFGALNIALDEVDINVETESAVVLLEGETVVATSPMSELRNSVLLVNSDLYRTGLSGIDKYDAPSVLTELDEGVYTLRGFPASTKEKLLLIVMSRYIERRALEVGAGRLDVAFQRLSRIEDEYGTRTVYKRLAETEVDVHAYGVLDADISEYDGMTIHTGNSDRYRNSWFVVFAPPDDREPAALVAVETGENVWRSRWTYDSNVVEDIQQYISEHF